MEGAINTVKKEPEILFGLDLGTSKVAVVVAERDYRSNEAQIIGMGHAPSQGIRKGLIVNLEKAVQSIRQAVKDAENMVGFEITEATVAFSGVEAKSVKSRGMVSLGRSPRQITIDDIERVIEAAQSELSVPSNRCVLHTVPVKYSIDGNSGIDDPMGMTGIRLEIELQSVVVPTSILQNVINCVERAGIYVTGLVIKPLANALGALTPEEMRSGAVSISLGGGTTGIALFMDGRSVSLSVIPIGGDHITNDLAYVMKIPISVAEDLKKQVSLNPEDFDDDAVIEVDVRGQTRSMYVKDIVEVISCRLEELFAEHISRQFSDYSLHMFPSGAVLSGGVARMQGLELLAGGIMGIPVRTALPVNAHQMPPGKDGSEYAALAGIIRYTIEKEKNPYKYIEAPLDLLRQGTFTPVDDKHGRQREKQRKHSDFAIQNVFDAIITSFKELF